MNYCPRINEERRERDNVGKEGDDDEKDGWVPLHLAVVRKKITRRNSRNCPFYGRRLWVPLIVGDTFKN